jgi:hypothetical protein
MMTSGENAHKRIAQARFDVGEEVKAFSQR